MVIYSISKTLSFQQNENKKLKYSAYSRLSVLLGINIIGFLRERSNFTAGDPSISLAENHFSEFVT